MAPIGKPPWRRIPSGATLRCALYSSRRSRQRRRATMLDPLRAVLINQHDARRVIRALPRVLDQMFEPMDRFRHGFIANLYEAEAETPA
jgi:hypothetical protein